MEVLDALGNHWGRLLLVTALGGCAGSGSGGQIAPNPSPALPVATPSTQDQRIELAQLQVSVDAPKIDPAPVSGQAHALHKAADMQRVASEGARDVRSCAAESQGQAATTPPRGALVMSLEVDSAGVVLGGATEPRGGEAGLSRVASCLLRRARQWTFPPRTTTGSTVVVIPYQLE